MDLPRVLVLGTSSLEGATKIAKEIGTEDSADGENFRCFVWTIDNKYYSAKVLLFVTNVIPNEASTRDVEAVVIHYDSKEKDVKCLDDYIPLINSLPKADILVLACQSFDDEETKEKVTEWSHAHNFEMVQMEASNRSDIMDEDENNICGTERIVEALQTHLWPNRILKAQSLNSKTELLPEINGVEDRLENMRLGMESRENSEQLLMDSVFDGIMGEENTDFGELFGRLMDMKEHATTLSSNNRPAAAEQLVKAFWKAMGGDPYEFEGLDE